MVIVADNGQQEFKLRLSLISPKDKYRVADQELELRGKGGRGGSVLLAVPAFPPSMTSSFLPKIRGGGSPPSDPPLE